jgi:archaellum component FlaC
MPDYVTRQEFEARVGVLEREVEGEKMVTRHILEQTRRNSDDLAGIITRLDGVETRLDRVETRLDRVETRLDGVETRLDGVERKLDALGTTVSGLSRNLPTIIADVMREVLRERDERG